MVPGREVNSQDRFQGIGEVRYEEEHYQGERDLQSSVHRGSPGPSSRRCLVQPFPVSCGSSVLRLAEGNRVPLFIELIVKRLRMNIDSGPRERLLDEVLHRMGDIVRLGEA